jgi:hypothetical protein
MAQQSYVRTVGSHAHVNTVHILIGMNGASKSSNTSPSLTLGDVSTSALRASPRHRRCMRMRDHLSHVMRQQDHHTYHQ